MRWLERLRAWAREIRRRLRIAAVRRILRQIAASEAGIESAQIDLERVSTLLEKEKNPQRRAQLEGDQDAFKRRIEWQRNRIAKLREKLDELDPDGSIRASLPPGG